MRHAAHLARLYAEVARPILFLGPVGVGKTHLARTAHEHSDRQGPFVALSAGELTGNLYSDTLFGHTSGAFTGAGRPREGAVERASGGTLLIDDLALLPIAPQSALLRILESRRYRPLGATGDRVTTAGFFFASTRPLPELVREGVILQDLASRIGELVIRVAPLRQRSDEILPMARHAAREFLREHGRRGSVEFTEATRVLLERYPWPQNVRELRAVVERAVLHAGMSGEVVQVRPGHLPDRFHHPFDEDEQVELTRSLVMSVLEEAEGNQSEAARRLGVHRNTIARYLRDAG